MLNTKDDFDSSNYSETKGEIWIVTMRTLLPKLWYRLKTL